MVTMALWWYVTSGRRLVDSELPPSVIRRFRLTLLMGAVAFSIVLMVLIGAGIGGVTNPLLLGYLELLGYVLLGVFEGWEPRSEERRRQGAPEDGASERQGDSASSTDG